MESPAGEDDALPRWVRYLAMPLAGLCLTLLFIHLGFPYEPLVARACQQLEQQQGIAVRYDEVSGHLSVFGPGVQARRVVISRPGSDDIGIHRLIVRLAWSTTWLRGQPSVHVDARVATGRARVAIAVGAPPRVEGSLDGLDLAALPIARYANGLKLRGTLDAEIDIRSDAESNWTGSATVSLEEGSLGLPGQPIAIPFDSLDAQLTLGPDDKTFLTIESASLVGPMVSASASGQIARSRSGPGTLDIELELSVVDKGLLPLFRKLGVRLSDNGKATARLGGTLASPVLN